MSLRKLIATARALRELGFDEVYITKDTTEEKREEFIKEEKEDKAELLRKLYKQMEEERKCILYEGSSGYVFRRGRPKLSGGLCRGSTRRRRRQAKKTLCGKGRTVLKHSN
jgi:hypothetical protein